MQVLWLLIDVAVGVLVAGVIAPVAVRTLPASAFGPHLLLAIAAICVIVVSVVRRVVVGTPGTRGRP